MLSMWVWCIEKNKNKTKNKNKIGKYCLKFHGVVSRTTQQILGLLYSINCIFMLNLNMVMTPGMILWIKILKKVTEFDFSSTLNINMEMINRNTCVMFFNGQCLIYCGINCERWPGINLPYEKQVNKSKKFGIWPDYYGGNKYVYLSTFKVVLKAKWSCSVWD